jgi:hypothetical protein
LLSLFTDLLASYSTASGKGLPIGNLTSQHFGNVYLDEFDHWVKEDQRTGPYVCYMDDMLCFGIQVEMKELRNRSVEWLGEHLALSLNHRGEINHCAKGLPFVGFVTRPESIRLSQRSEHRLRTKFRKLERSAVAGRIGEAELQERSTSLFASAAHGSTSGLRRHLAATSRFSGCADGLQPRHPRRQLEQQRQQLPHGQPQQEQPGQQEQQHRVPLRPLRQCRGRDSG